jgi:hypothetical protein
VLFEGTLYVWMSLLKKKRKLDLFLKSDRDLMPAWVYLTPTFRHGRHKILLTLFYLFFSRGTFACRVKAKDCGLSWNKGLCQLESSMGRILVKPVLFCCFLWYLLGIWQAFFKMPCKQPRKNILGKVPSASTAEIGASLNKYKVSFKYIRWVAVRRCKIVVSSRKIFLTLKV